MKDRSTTSRRTSTTILGGVEVLSGTFGGDCTQAFKKAHRWVNGHALLGKCRVGAVEGAPPLAVSEG